MLFEFLEKHKAQVLALAEDKTLKLAGPLLSSVELKKGLPVFYDHLIGFLKSTNTDSSEEKIVTAAAQHGKELMHLNYTLSHVVHSYGALCQSVTEVAQDKKAEISAQDFNNFNLCLDIAIASAVSEFQYHSVHALEVKEVQHLGFLAHELRNALSSATVAFEMIKQGLVGSNGSTARVVGENLLRMRNLIDRSLSEVRMRADPQVNTECFNLKALVDQILVTAKSEAQIKNQRLINEVNSDLNLETDRQLLLSCIANLVQNALKFNKLDGVVTVRATSSEIDITLEIEDECGGIHPEVLKNIYKPFASGGFNQSGLGLGLTIVQKAVSMLEGSISINNFSGKGCAFRITIPKKLEPKPAMRPNADETGTHPTSNRK